MKNVSSNVSRKKKKHLLREFVVILRPVAV